MPREILLFIPIYHFHPHQNDLHVCRPMVLIIIVILFNRKKDAEVIFANAEAENMTGEGYAWIVTEQAIMMMLMMMMMIMVILSNMIVDGAVDDYHCYSSGFSFKQYSCGGPWLAFDECQ